MAKHNKKGVFELADQENLGYLRLQGRIVLNRVLNEVEDLYYQAFNEAMSRGKIYRVEDSKDDLWRFLKQGVLMECAAIEQGQVDSDDAR